MKLKEQFEKVYYTSSTYQQFKNCEIVSNQFAIGFAEWIVFIYKEGILYPSHTTKELLEIYKKEKGL